MDKKAKRRNKGGGGGGGGGKGEKGKGERGKEKQEGGGGIGEKRGKKGMRNKKGDRMKMTRVSFEAIYFYILHSTFYILTYLTYHHFGRDHHFMQGAQQIMTAPPTTM